MKSLLGLLLALGALIGLLGQQAAYARGVALAVSAPAAAGMDADCMAMMKNAEKPGPTPCKGMTLDCIAAMGCTVPLTLGEEPSFQLIAVPRPTLMFWPQPHALAGAEVGPELHPPSV
jgi:hypothetical protein